MLIEDNTSCRESVCSLLLRKIIPKIHLIRENHEAADVNALFGFHPECIERMREDDGIWSLKRFNQLFNHLPLAALVKQKIMCMHGSIGRSVEQIDKLERPINMDVGSVVFMDLLWSDPTENHSVEGLIPTARGTRPCYFRGCFGSGLVLCKSGVV